jgi:hypothetical protein
MPSPFPGMNPYLDQEAVWQDFHQSFIPAARAAIVPQLQGDYFVKLAVYVFPRDQRHSFLEIRDQYGSNLVTVVELLSPSNKCGDNRATYLDKRKRMIDSGTNLVELDLLRGGPRLPIDGLPPCDYYALVVRQEGQGNGVWAFRLHDPLPTIPIPLRRPHADASMNLKSVLDRVYDGARYEKFIYVTGPQPPLTPEQQQWAKQYLPAAVQ